MRIFCFALFLLAFPGSVLAQFKAPTGDAGPGLGRTTTVRIQVGFTIKPNGTLQRVVATAPVPAEWPEQHVRVANEEVTPSTAHVSYRTIEGGGGVKQMVLEIPRLSAGQEARALITFEVTRTALTAPQKTDIFTIPEKPDRSLALNLGVSPFIESRHPKINSAAKEAVGDLEGAWEKVEAIYDWVRENVAYKTSEPKSATRAMYDKEGGADELTSIFVAMCRAQKIPARTVFVLGHCYAEFYLEDDAGVGHWFPCQLAGKREFGGIENIGPILQKGDNFRNPQNPKEKLRYVTNYFNAAGKGKAPKVSYVSKLVAE